MMRRSLSWSSSTASGASKSGSTPVLGLGEGDDLADALDVQEEHDESLDAGRYAAVRGRAVLEGVE